MNGKRSLVKSLKDTKPSCIYKIVALDVQEERMFTEIQSEIVNTLSQSERTGQNVVLIAVSKTRTIDEVIAIYEDGARHFGENYVQEALTKIKAVPDEVKPRITWHLIGPLQSNKAKIAAEHFDWVQTVSSLKLAKLLSKFRTEALSPLQVCIQVNIDQSSTKKGASANREELLQLILEVSELPRLTVRGLMVMPDDANAEKTAVFFAQSNELFKEIRGRLSPDAAQKFDTLSMGMSGDFELAIAAGSTMVRIGTALFGSREPAS